MLGKLIKYEFRATARLFLPIYVAIAILAGLMCLLRALPADSGILSFLTFIVGLLYVAAALGLAVTTVVVLVSRFYKNLLGPEGYLMFTLPVTAGQNVLAKLIPALCWTIGSSVLCFLVLILQEMLNGGFRDRTLLQPDNLGVYIFLVLALAAFILFCYMCMAIGQTFNEHKFLASIGAFIVIQLVLQILGLIGIFSLGRLGLLAGFDLSLDTFPGWVWVAGADLAALAVCAVLFLITRWLLEKKLNLA
ncbi:MAG: hypothetical protein IK116_04160 [Firmicutes bacterium]|nr:hypothetical protein [Bacillota bacterium]